MDTEWIKTDSKTRKDTIKRHSLISEAAVHIRYFLDPFQLSVMEIFPRSW
jgi:hypothetical protein